ncbi:MAG: 50S ribosomal protein L6, partial [Gemmatimonadota bacterium]
MSRIGDQPVEVPDDVQVSVNGSRVTVEGPEGELERSFHPDMEIELSDGELVVRRPTDHQRHRSLHGLTRSLL